jgi:segregation and condensation protein A
MDALDAAKPVAVVSGEAVTALPEDLYIPPDALEVFLETFEGPLDLLLYLIKKQNLDILNIPVRRITSQYMEYITLMESMRLELAAEYLVMAAMLCEIKSRMLLPRQEELNEDEDDPRAELVRRLLEYERFKQAAIDLDTIPRMERDVVVAQSDCDTDSLEKPVPDVTFDALIQAFRDVLIRAENFSHHNVTRESLSIRARMGDILEKLNEEGFVYFTALFRYKEGRNGLVVTFIAILELVKQSMIHIVQTDAFSPIHVSVAK